MKSQIFKSYFSHFKNVMYDEEIKKAKEIERIKWLKDLENQKNEKLIESQQQKAYDKYKDFSQSQRVDNNTTFQPNLSDTENVTSSQIIRNCKTVC